MENRKLIKFLFSIFIFGFLITQASVVFAYGIETHAYLTNEAIKFYNQKFSDNKINEELIPYLLDGARQEDDIPRWMNHFYDPVYNRGLTDSILGTWQKSKNWARDSENQNSLTYKVPTTIASILTAIQQKKISALTTETDFTWERAVKFYIQGEKEKAMLILGHILHLMEDKSVPDHTRNDPHPGDSPYENYTHKFTLSNLDADLNKRLLNKSPFVFSDLNSYFDGLAKYSNNNFYSKDTIGIQSGYELPQPDIEGLLKKDGDYYYIAKYDEDHNLYYLFVYKNYRNNLILETKSNIVLKIEDEDKVVNNYWSRLSVKSIQYGAGVINLFFQEVKKAKENPNFLKQPEKSFWGKTVDAVKNVFASTINSISLIINSDNNVQQFSADVNKIITENFQENISENKEVIIPIEIKNQIIENPKIAEQQTQQIISKPKEEIKPQQIIQKTEEIIQKEQPQIIENTQPVSNKIVFKFTGGGSSGESSGGSSSGSPTPENTGASSAPVIYPKILINEIQLSSTSSVHDEFVELYNPNNESVDLTNWYVQKKTANGTNFSTFATANSFNGKTIGAKGFILIAHSSSTFIYDIVENYSISDNNVLVLKNPNGEIVDKVGWGTANDCEGSPFGECASNPTDGQSAQRIFQNNEFIDTDNNAQDFEIQTCPSPNAQSASCQIAGPEPEQNNSTSTETVATSTLSHLVISEIQVRGDGADDEFIEIYNPNDSAISLDNYSIQYLSGLATSTDNVAKKNFSSSAQITAKSFYLLANTSATSTIKDRADMTYSAFSLSGSSNGATIFLVSSSTYISSINDQTIVDSLSYGSPALAVSAATSTVPPTNQSLERKAFATSTIDSMATGEHHFSGNGYDVDSADDFVLRSSAEPQNSQNFPEPRTSPTIPQNFNIQYSSSTMSLDLSWQVSQDYSGATPTISYRITDISNSSSTFLEINTTSTSASISINENNFGKTYLFSIQAFDREDLNSESSQKEISIPNSTLIAAQQLDKSAFEQGTGNGQFYQYLGNGLLGSPSNITFHAKFLSGSNNPAYYFEAVFWQSDTPDYANLTQISSNICNRTSTNWPVNNCPDFGFEYDVDKDYTIPVQQNFVFDPNKYYKVKFYTFQATAVFYGSSDVNSYKYGEAARDNGGGSEISSSLKDIYFKIETASPIEIFSDVNIGESVAQNFEANYSTSTLELSLIWDKPRYFDENSPALTYRITDNSSLVSSSTLVLPEIIASTTSTTIILSEVGRKYKFSIQAFDNNNNSTLASLGRDIFIPYSLSSQFIIIQQPDYSVSEIGSGNGEFYQTIGNNISGGFGAIAIKAGPPGYYISVRARPYNDADYSLPDSEVFSEIAFCVGSSQSYPGEPLCSDYYIDSDTITVPRKNNFTFNPEKYYKLLFVTYQSQSTFYGSSDANSYPNGQSTKNNGGSEIPTSPIQDVYFKILSSTAP